MCLIRYWALVYFCERMNDTVHTYLRLAAPRHEHRLAAALTLKHLAHRAGNLSDPMAQCALYPGRS